MTLEHRDAFGQPVGFPVTGWSPPARPPREPIAGRYCRLEPLDPGRHAEELYRASAADATGRSWTYMAYGPFATFAEYRAWLQAFCLGDDPLFYAVVDAATGKAAGVAAYQRVDPANGTIEIGHIHFSPALQRTRAATEAIYLLMRRAFALGYRRCEWKCDALNAASRAAARRFGFSFEGLFRRAAIYKGRNRDTAWYAVVDADWPALERAFLAWLDPANFDEHGVQRTRLSSLTAPLRRSPPEDR